MINTFDELLERVEQGRNAVLTLELEVGAPYSKEYEDAKKQVEQARALELLAGDNKAFLGGSLDELVAKAEALKPKADIVELKFRKVSLNDWNKLLREPGEALEQYNTLAKKTFIGVFAEGGEEPLSTDSALVRPESAKCIVPPGAISPLVQAFLEWQSSGGAVEVRPTK